MRSFKSLAFLVILLCLTDFAHSLPAPQTAGKAAAKNPATVKKLPAKKPTTKPTTTAKKPVTTKKATTTKKAGTATTKATTTAGKKSVTSVKKGTSTAKNPVSTAGNNPTSTSISEKPTATGKPGNSTLPTSPIQDSDTTTASCPIRKPPAKPAKTTVATKLAKTVRDFIDGLIRRADTPIFIGYHGTNQGNALIYQNAKQIVVPKVFNGNNGELSGGLYVTDSIFVASSFGQSSAKNRILAAEKAKCPLKETDNAAIAVVCTVEAKSDNFFINTLRKVWIPTGEIATKNTEGVNDLAKLEQQVARIKAAGGDENETLRFSVLNNLDPTDPDTGNQVMIPIGSFSKFQLGICLPLKRVPGPIVQFKELTSFGEGAAALPKFPDFNYREKVAEFNIDGDPFATS